MKKTTLHIYAGHSKEKIEKLKKEMNPDIEYLCIIGEKRMMYEDSHIKYWDLKENVVLSDVFDIRFDNISVWFDYEIKNEKDSVKVYNMLLSASQFIYKDMMRQRRGKILYYISNLQQGEQSGERRPYKEALLKGIKNFVKVLAMELVKRKIVLNSFYGAGSCYYGLVHSFLSWENGKEIGYFVGQTMNIGD